METIKYKDMELLEFTSDKPVVFEKPRAAVVWDFELKQKDGTFNDFYEVVAYIPGQPFPVITAEPFTHWKRMALIPEKPASRRATWKQLAYWLIDGKGLVLDADTNRVDTGVYFDMKNMHEEVGERYYVMARGESIWHEPTVDYMGLEEA